MVDLQIYVTSEKFYLEIFLSDIVVFYFFIFLFFYSESKSQCTAVIGSNISPIKGCEILTVQFNDLSTGPVQNRTWNFGDGSTTSGAQNPSHSYVSGVN